MDFVRRPLAAVLRLVSPRLLAAFALWRADRNELASSWWLGMRRAIRRDQEGK
jgi:hypothetical protein